ncbi:MAG TPA: hypothetical protein VIQ53_26705 [Inquilinus sp.]
MPNSSPRTPTSRIAALAAAMVGRHAEMPDITPPPPIDPAGGRFAWAAWYREQVGRRVEAGVDPAEARRMVQRVAKDAIRRGRPPSPVGAEMRRVRDELQQLLAAGIAPVREQP